MNAVDAGQSNKAFSSSMFNLLDRVEYRRISTSLDFEEVEKLRRISYNSREFIDAERFGSFIDEYDGSPDCYVIGVYVEIGRAHV